jgi:hypothetical protein
VLPSSRVPVRSTMSTYSAVLSVRKPAALFAHQGAQAGSAQDDHRAGRVRDDVLAHRAKQHACEAPMAA